MRARGAQKDRLLAELRPSLEARIPCFLTGDFNEPSFQDWTKSVAATGRIPLKVEYPATKAIVDVGMLDGYRVGYPDPVKSPGWTWTPTTQPTDPRDRHDRIDFVFSSLKPKSVKNPRKIMTKLCKVCMPGPQSEPHGPSLCVCPSGPHSVEKSNQNQ